jgi:hypothetical protein
MHKFKESVVGRPRSGRGCAITIYLKEVADEDGIEPAAHCGVQCISNIQSPGFVAQMFMWCDDCQSISESVTQSVS